MGVFVCKKYHKYTCMLCYFLDLSPSDCTQTYFYCTDSKRCIESYLICDRVNHCSNGEDEERDGESQCNPTAESKYMHKALVGP